MALHVAHGSVEMITTCKTQITKSTSKALEVIVNLESLVELWQGTQFPEEW